MATAAAHTPIEESYTGIYGKRHIELAKVAGCLSCIGHADGMVGHVATASHFLGIALVSLKYYSGHLIVATEAIIGFRVHAAGELVVILGRKAALASLQMGFGGKLPV